MNGANQKPTGLTLTELVRLARELVGERADAKGSRRSRFTLRTARFYTTLGLLDRPVLRRRTGYYGLRHLLQLLAIRRLQDEGLSLAEIQQTLYGRTDAELAQLAGVDPEALLRREPRLKLEAVGESARRTAWWRVPRDSEPAVPRPSRPPVPQVWQAIDVAPDLMLLVRTPRPLNPSIVRVVARAAQPLATLLRELGICGRAGPAADLRRDQTGDWGHGCDDEGRGT